VCVLEIYVLKRHRRICRRIYLSINLDSLYKTTLPERFAFVFVNMWALYRFSELKARVRLHPSSHVLTLWKNSTRCANMRQV